MKNAKNNIKVLSAVIGAVMASPAALADNLLKNSGLETLLVPWVLYVQQGEATAKATVENGRACVEVTNPGSMGWHVQFRQPDPGWIAGRTYTFSADAWASEAVSLNIQGDSYDLDGEFVWHFGDAVAVPATPLSGDPTPITASFVNEIDGSGGTFGIHLGSELVPAGATVCLDNIVLDDPEAVLEPDPTEIPLAAVKVNQVGYSTGLAKEAVYTVPAGDTAATAPKTWELQQGGTVVASGMTQPSGTDEASGDTVHLIDFSSYQTAGDDFTLVVDGASSHRFSIGDDVYSDLKYDALVYFYHNRASTPILADVVGEAWARDAGHPDKDVQTVHCIETVAPIAGWEYPVCEERDVSGGWYDAGDHGKYVVNGGISAWTMMNQFERSQSLGSNAGAFADGTMALPAAERSNGVPDLLDEVRYEMEFIIKMQVPEGSLMAGMVHHKIHSLQWTPLPQLPSTDAQVRVLQPPSTAATLNAAATGAQCARVFASYDADFATKCLTMARTAYAAAKANPNFAARATPLLGAGPYTDGDVSDEFYWAATELYLATGEQSYLTDMQGSPFHAEFFLGGPSTSEDPQDYLMAWPRTQGLGLMSLAVASEEYVRDDGLQVAGRDYLMKFADRVVAEHQAQGYRLPFAGQKADWGSNSHVLNNMLLLGLANDFSCGADPAYLNAMQAGLNYLLGVNPMDQSYVTGYGERPLTQPHHRFWANSKNSAFPVPPPGAVSGGPNAGGGWSDVELANLAGCDPLKCFLDNIEAYAVNEITINWNAPFAWVTAYLDEQSSEAGRAALCDGSGPDPEPTDPEPTDPEPTDPEPTDPEPEPTDPEPTPTDPEPQPEPRPIFGAATLWELLAALGLAGAAASRRRRH